MKADEALSTSNLRPMELGLMLSLARWHASVYRGRTASDFSKIAKIADLQRYDPLDIIERFWSAEILFCAAPD